MAETRGFDRCAERQDRMTFLQQLVDQLSFDERRAVAAMVSNRNDPMAVLSLELIIEIMSHLPIFEPWRLQLVGRRWRTLLSSKAMLRASLTRWETHSVSDSARGPSLAGKGSIRARVRHIQAMRLGCPFAAASIRCSPPTRPWPTEQVIALKGSRLAWIRAVTGEGHSVQIKQLVTGELTTVRGEARETIHNIALGSDVLAFVTHSGKLYAQNLSDLASQPSSVRLPSATVQAMYVDKTMVGVVLNSGKSVALYDTETGSLRSFNVHFGQGMPEAELYRIGFWWDTSLLIDCHAGTVDVFRHTKTRPGTIIDNQTLHDKPICFISIDWQHARYSFEGQQIATSCLQMSKQYLPRKILPQYRDGAQVPELDYCSVIPSGYDGLYNIGNGVIWPVRYQDADTYPYDSSTKTSQRRTEKSRPYQICFDARTAELRRNYLIGLGDVIDTVMDTEQAYRMTTWKDVHFKFRTDEEPSTALATRNVAGSPSSSFGLSTRICYPRFLGNPRYWQTSIVGVNDSFLVTMHLQLQNDGQMDGGSTRILIHCFDETLACEGFQDTGIWARAGKISRCRPRTATPAALTQ